MRDFILFDNLIKYKTIYKKIILVKCWKVIILNNI